MAEPRVEKGYEKHAWLTFVPLQVLAIFFGLSFILAAFDLGGAGTSFPRDAALVVGLTSVALGVVTLPIVLKWYRRGVAWAWYGLWTAPIFFVARFLEGVFLGEEMNPGPLLFAVLSLLALILPYRKFFPQNPYQNHPLRIEADVHVSKVQWEDVVRIPVGSMSPRGGQEPFPMAGRVHNQLLKILQGLAVRGGVSCPEPRGAEACE